MSSCFELHSLEVITHRFTDPYSISPIIPPVPSSGFLEDCDTAGAGFQEQGSNTGSGGTSSRQNKQEA